ncbi:MAG: DMT family transporter [Sulfitobacter sp.]
MSPNVTGAFLMGASMVAFTINDTFVKLTGGTVPLFQLIFLRGVLVVTLIALLAHHFGALKTRVAPADLKLITLRSAAEVSSTYFFLSALFNMPIGNLTAVLQVLPLTVTLGSALIFREAVGWRRLLAILIGFGGVLLIIRPGPDGFNIWSIYALLAVLSVTLRDLTTRRLSGDVPGITVSLATAIVVTLFAGLASTTESWVAISPANGAKLVGAALFIMGGYYYSVQAMRVGDVSFVAPFRYAGLLAGMLAGLLVFGESYDALTLLGAAIIAATGLFTLYRERATRRGPSARTRLVNSRRT